MNESSRFTHFENTPDFVNYNKIYAAIVKNDLASVYPSLAVKRLAWRGLILVLMVLIVVGIQTHVRLIRLTQHLDEQWTQVAVQYQHRIQMIPHLVQTISSEPTFDKATLTEITQAQANLEQIKLDPKQAPSNASQLQKYQQAQDALTHAVAHVLIASQHYPSLKANRDFQKAEVEFITVQNRFALDLSRFDRAAQSYNNALHAFPTGAYAAIFGFTSRPSFQAPEGSNVSSSSLP